MKLLNNYLYLAVAEGISKVVTFAAIAYVARVADPAGYGYVEFAGALALCAGLIVDQGFGTYGAREIAKAPERTPALAADIISARAILAVAAYAVVALFSLALDRPPIVSQLLLIYGLSLLVMPVLLQWIFQGYNQMGAVAVIQTLRQVVYAAVIFGLLRTASQIWVAGLAEVLGAAAAAAYGVWMYRSRFAGRITIHRAIARQTFTDGVPIGLSQLFWMVRMFGATVVIGLIAAPADVGFFGAAMRILIAAHTFVWLYYFNLLPSLAQAWQRGDGALAVLLDRSLRYVAWACAWMLVVWLAAAPWAMTLLYGRAFAPAGAVLQWLAGVAVLAALSGHYRYGLIAAGLQNIETAISAVGAAAALAAIPIGYVALGPAGAAVGLLLAEAVVWLAAWWVAAGRLGLAGHAALLVRPAAAAALTLAVLPFVPGAALRILAAAVVAGALALLFDGALRSSLWQLRSHLLRRGVAGRAHETAR